MKTPLPIALLLLYACTFRAAAQPSRPWSGSQDTALLPIITLAPPARRSSQATGPYTAFRRPVSGRAAVPSLTAVTLRVFNPSHYLALPNIKLEWALEVNGSLRQKGATGRLSVAPGHTLFVHIPARLPGGDSNEIYLRLRCLRLPLPSAAVRRTAGQRPKVLPASPLMLEDEQLLVQAPAGHSPEVRPDGDLTFTDNNDTFTIQSPLIHIEFNKQTGWLQRYEVNGAILLTDTPVLKSNFWRPGLPGDTSAAWQEASRDPHLQLFSTSTGNTMIIVRAEYTLPATSCLLHLSYIINAKGEMLIGQQLETDSLQKGEALPCFGMRWQLPAGYDSIEYYGLGRTDTPVGDSTNARDSIRMHSPWVALYHDTVNPSPPGNDQRNTSMNTGLITAIRWIRISNPDGNGLLITADSSLLNAGALQTAPSVILNIDSRQPAAPGLLPGNRQLSYGLTYRNYRCTYKISPISSLHTALTTRP